MWKPFQDVKDGIEPNDSKFDDRPTQRRRWDSISYPKLLPSHLEYSPPRSSYWNVANQVPFECKQQHSTTYLEYSGLSSLRPERWDVSTQVPSKPKFCSSYIEGYVPSRPFRIAGGNGCNCCPCPPSFERPVESCLPGLHQKHKEAYDSKKCLEGHLPSGYRSFVEHDDLYLPPSRPLSPSSVDHDDLYLPLKTHDEYSPRCPCPSDLRICDSDPTYGDIYLPPSRPCTPTFPKDPCGYSIPCPPLPCKPSPLKPCNPCPSPPSPPQPSSCGPKIQCFCPPYIKKLAPCPAPPSNDCNCPPYIKKLPSCSSPPPNSSPPSPPSSPTCSRSRLVRQCSSVYIDEVPSPLVGNHYIACKECLCHKDISTRSLCPSPKNISPCRDCVCHLGARSPSQGVIGCPIKNTHSRCYASFQTPSKPRFKLHLNQSQCLECKSPYNCKGPSNCNPQYIVETPLSPNFARSKSPSLDLRSKSPLHNGNYFASPMVSSRCQSCNCHKIQDNCSRPPKFNPKLLEDPCCSPCTQVTPCRPLLVAEMLTGTEAYISEAKTCGKSPSSCLDPQCATCECYMPKCISSPPPCKSPPPFSPHRLVGPSCSTFNDDVDNTTCKRFQSTSPRCKDCDFYKPKNCKLSSQICKFCRGAGICYCESYTTQKLFVESFDPSIIQHDELAQVEGTLVSEVSNILPKTTCQLDSKFSTTNTKVNFDPPCNEDIESTSRILGKDVPIQLDVTQLCCCGKCEYTKPWNPIKIECPFCKHTHSCCCGMCSCPIPSCSSKTPLVLDNPTPHSPLNSSGDSTGRYGFLPLKSKSMTLATKKKLGFISPEKSSRKPFLTSNSQLSSSRMCNSSPKTRMKLSIQESPK